uniref:D-xylose 1-dehydrogenase (NADP(+), D-xylono-1,5-lactone-forming) n=2 Tax=Octactis speculum TaxID=3111310 RepID=A0A7S2HBY4_9STRA|mmetsp:Transcript_63361/g.87128  ORF Transcript_63361/g.87128 Transcript_63361/m.87128 type:complete len:349 (+) Transcript_63361:18-1064(+)|eukprot:CAMPEP_0185750778 /NCGR_PEP_ID=MMETSP1174-20130828/9544_1 /TAXON_ID=35687 /ORGANISM="Dictyocha speculum, Strain CCMP1381" /LENGTH=348 /DNA_ID=CAMNT_0028427447 /DNA_START=21 /DNA_END=1067 /DNA_ORIENTATION=+
MAAVAEANLDTPNVPRIIRWGILGTGTIASDFTTVLNSLPNTEVVAVGSRSQEGADRFGDKFGITVRHASYEALAADNRLDVVYVATPSLRHVGDCELCLQAGRHVLCEKSMAPGAPEAKAVLDLARTKGLFFLHGVWSRFFPAMAALRDVIASGKIGTVTSASASFGQNDGAGACSAVLETGIYCAQFLQWAFEDDPPDAVQGVVANMHENGLDQHVNALIRFPKGRVGDLECSLRNPTPRAAIICGTEGVITVPFPFWCPTKFTVQRMTGLGSQTWGEEEVFEFSLPDISGDFNFINSQGLAYEAEEVNRCIRGGLIESPQFTSSACLSVMEIITSIRDQFPVVES